jgi:hypothetical protein
LVSTQAAVRRQQLCKEGKGVDIRGFSSPCAVHNLPLATPVVLRGGFSTTIGADLNRPLPHLASILATPAVFRVVLFAAVLTHFNRPFPLLYHWASRRCRLTGGLGGKLQARLPALC